MKGSRNGDTVGRVYWANQFLAVGYGTGGVRIAVFLYMVARFPKGCDQPMGIVEYQRVMGAAMWTGFWIVPVIVHFCTRAGKNK